MCWVLFLPVIYQLYYWVVIPIRLPPPHPATPIILLASIDHLSRQAGHNAQSEKFFEKKSYSIPSINMLFHWISKLATFRITWKNLKFQYSDCMSVCLVTKSCPTLKPHGLYPARLLRPQDSPGENTGVGCHSLLERIFPTQGSNPHLHWQACSLPLSHLSSPFRLHTTPKKKKKSLGVTPRHYYFL